MAYCGLNCAECPAYLATLSGSEHSREKIAKEWSGIYNTEFSPDEISCMGCKSKEGIQFSHCFECSIRLCAVERSIATCADCVEFPCIDLKEMFELVPIAGQNLENLRCPGVEPDI
ncbi:MAG: DUF3795 domain-containing protein [Candidatus Fermentibacteria bacterium]